MKFFWKRNEQKSPGLPVLPDAVNDNMYLAAASKAGELDKASGAYDHFLFEENSLREMPFERAVDTHLNLISIRLEDRGRRELLNVQKKTLEGRAKAEISRIKVEQLSGHLEALDVRLEEQKEILRSEKAGRHGLLWPGTLPEVTTQFSGFVKTLVPYLVFVIVGLVDVGIVYFSLNTLPGFSNFEPILFSAPVIGVQLIFPHLIGQRLSLLSHGTKDTRRNAIEIIIFALVWITFAISITEIRMNYIDNVAQKENTDGLSSTLYYLLWVTNFLMLVGLGSWLLFLESRRNHHEHDALRLILRSRTIERRRQSAIAKFEKAKSAIPSLELAETVAIASYEDAVRSSGSALGEAAKAVYRRALINQVGTPEFTGSYIGSKPGKKGIVS